MGRQTVTANSMQYRKLGDSGIDVSLMSYGTGGPSGFGKSAGLSAKQRAQLVAKAIDLGVNLFDTAAGYGDSEAWLGDALNTLPSGDVMVATKWSWRPGGADGELPPARDLLASVEGSLQRLRRDSIDIMQIHGLNQQVYDDAVDRYGETMLDLKRSGKARLIGFSEMMTEDPTHTVPLRALTHHAELWDTIMLKYGILNQCAAQSVLPLALQHGVGILNMAPVRYTLTQDDEFRKLIATWAADGTIEVKHPKLRDGLGWLVAGEVDSVVSAGYKFAAAHPAISTVICGTSNTEHLVANAKAIEFPSLPQEHMDTLRDLLSESASPR